ncbi:MAG TPA: cytochrome c peroxidase [Gemmatimonadales bacterium]|nr:cytochrome c peroxidase [Gemmatimonadales bacterium]
MMPRTLAGFAGVCATLWLAGCSEKITAPSTPSTPDIEAATAEVAALAAEVRLLAANRGITPMPAPAPVRRELSLLGQALAFDKILSGNRDISCMTCHLAGIATTDSRSVSIGQGATGLGPDRVHPQGKFVHRSAPPLFNLHVMTTLTWDGRIFLNPEGVVRSPNALNLAQQAVLEFGALSALPMFPVLSRPEMRADAGNELALVSDAKPQQTWRLVMRRLGAIPQYRTMFESAYPGQSFDSMNFAHAGNAIGGWITAVFAFNNTPWDSFLAGNDDALTETQLRGAKAFLGTGRCARCHNGPALSDGRFHNVAVAQVGPGFGDGPDGRDDFGRMRKTLKLADKYKFRTPPLRNVELTAPYGHDGAIVSLRAWVDHYSQSDVKLLAYDPGQLEPLLQGTLLPTASDILLTRDSRLATLVLKLQMVDDITEFLKALTDPAARDLARFVPTQVPSGLPVDHLP